MPNAQNTRVRTLRTRALPTLTLALAAVLVQAGCACPTGRHARTPARNLLFGPAWAGIPTFDVPRSDWPATTAGPAIDEHIEYRTTLYDWQGQFGRDDGTLYRRFRSERTGSTTRPRY